MLVTRTKIIWLRYNVKHMKTSQKGFIAPLLIILIAVLIIGGGVYEYQKNKSQQIALLPIVTATQQALPTLVLNSISPIDFGLMKKIILQLRYMAIKY